MTDSYASEEETRALLRKDTRTPAERKLDRMLDERGASEQGAEPALILRQIALELLAEQPAQQALDKMAENARELGLDYEPARCAPAADGVCESLDCPSHKPAQRTWVGLTAREVELIDGMIEVQLHHAAQCDRIANRTMADKQKVWDTERVELLRKLKEKNT